MRLSVNNQRPAILHQSKVTNGQAALSMKRLFCGRCTKSVETLVAKITKRVHQLNQFYCRGE
jgi:hypothetical protein